MSVFIWCLIFLSLCPKYHTDDDLNFLMCFIALYFLANDFFFFLSAALVADTRAR